MYGKIFKKLRLEQNIKQKDVAKQIISVASLSLWENGNGDIPFSKFIKLINRINLTPEEFIKITKITRPTPVVKKIEESYLNKDKTRLKKICQNRLELYKKRRLLNDLYVAVIACNYYYDLTNKNLLTTSYQQKIVDYLTDIPFLSQKYLSIYGNCSFLLSSRNLFGLSLSILHRWKEIEEWDNLNTNVAAIYNIAWQAVLNSLEVLIYRKDYILAKQLAIKVKAIKIKRDFLFVELRRKFLLNLLDYKTDNSKDLSQLQKVIEIAKYLNQKEVCFDFIETIKRLEND